MAVTRTDASQQNSSSTSDPNVTGDSGDVGNKTQGLQHSKQEPGDNEKRIEMDVNDGHGAEQEYKKHSPDSEVSKETVIPTENGEGETGCEHPVAETGPEHERSAGSTEPVESSRELKQEQRDESVSSPPSDAKTKGDETSNEKTDHGIKRRSSLEISSSDGEHLSRMDSEDRSVDY